MSKPRFIIYPFCDADGLGNLGQCEDMVECLAQDPGKRHVWTINELNAAGDYMWLSEHDTEQLAHQALLGYSDGPIYVGVLEHRRGDMTYFASRSHDGLRAQIAAYCRANWTEHVIDMDAPADDGDAISMYFEDNHSESYSEGSCPLA